MLQMLFLPNINNTESAIIYFFQILNKCDIQLNFAVLYGCVRRNTKNVDLHKNIKTFL